MVCRSISSSRLGKICLDISLDSGSAVDVLESPKAIVKSLISLKLLICLNTGSSRIESCTMGASSSTDSSVSFSSVSMTLMSFIGEGDS